MHLKTFNRTTNRPRPVTVHFPLPRKAVSKLRALAIGKDPRLLDLGVLAVQISDDDESIVLGIELDKAKKKSSVYANKAASSSFGHSSHERVDFNSKPGDPRSITTTTTFASPSYNYPGVYTTPHLSTARNDNFVAKTKKPAQNSAAKRRAKETLNAARRGRGRGRAGKTSGLQSNASVRASTWEMVYSHIGIPPEHRNKASNLLEPPVGSQASGIAHVPVAQTELPKENMLKSDGKRKTSVSSPPLKSPGHGAVYSEDDSSVSSSPCSHSPMNSEELMNLFVDSNFSATSVLKQLAESRSKEEEKQADIENNNDKSGTDKSFEACVDSQTKVTEPGSSMVGMAFDSSQHWGIFPKNSEANLSKIDNNFITDPKINKSNSEGEKTKTISTLSFGVQPTHQNSPSTSTLSSGSLIMSNTSVKRSASSLGDLYSGVSHPSITASQLLTESALHNLQSFKRSRIELEKQTDMVNSSKTNELSLPISSGSPTSTNATQLQSSKQLTVSSASSTKYPFSNLLTPATTATTNIALRNYLQYGYYYSSEELNRALAKSASSKNKSTSQNSFSQHSLYTSASSSITLTLSSSSNSNTTAELLKPKNQDGQPALINSTSSLLSTTTVTANSQVSFDLSQQVNESANGKDVDSKTSTQVSKVENSQALLSNVHGNNSSPSNECILKNSQCESNKSCTTSGTSGNPFITIATSSPTVLGSSDVTQPSVSVADSSSSSIQKTGRCYAISYVYPMGTVWYPYVAITPYAVLQKNAAESNDTEKSNSGTEAANNSNSTSQYIDLASSLRYWQQLSLLYKNQMLVTASANTNVLNSAVSLLHQNTTANGSGLSNSATCVSSKQSLSVSMMDSENERAKESFSLSGPHSDAASILHKQPSQGISSNPSDSSEKKPVRRASVIVAAKPSNMASSSVLLNSEQLYQHRSASSTPESEASSEGMQIKPEALVIDNCDRLIEEHCQRMNEVLADTPEDYSASHLGKNNLNSTTPSLSFIPDSSIAYINVGNNGSKKTAGNGKDGKSKSSKKKKSNKTT